MDRELLRTWAPKLVLLVVTLACIPLTISTSRQGSREAALEHQLGKLRRDARNTEARLERELRAARTDARRLRTVLAHSRADSESLRSQLADARASHQRLEQRLAEDPPGLGLHVEPSEPFSGLVALVDNAGADSIRIAESQGRLWIGGREALLPVGDSGVVLARGEERDVFEFPLLDWETGAVANGDLDLRGALCVVYRREGDPSAADWAREVWFERRPTGGLALLRQEHWSPGPDEIACDLAAVEPPWSAALATSPRPRAARSGVPVSHSEPDSR